MSMSESERYVSGRRAWRRYSGGLLMAGFMLATLVSVAVLLILLITILVDGIPTLDWQFITSYDSSRPERAGILAGLVGTIWVVGIAAVICCPLGVATALFLEEFAPRNWLTTAIQINISNLAGVPSIIYGLVGFAVFVQLIFDGQRGVIAGALTLTLLVLPIVIITAQETIRTVPRSDRLAAYAMGATKWQVVKHIVLPQSVPGISSGVILAYSRAIGETAPILVISSIVTITFLPANILDRFTILPLQIFNYIRRPQAEFHDLASSGIIVLLAVLLIMNSLAIIIRNRFETRRN